jgi:hypothetical protein
MPDEQAMINLPHEGEQGVKGKQGKIEKFSL